MLGYPLVRLVTLSLQEYGLPQVFGTPAPWVGLDNFREILTESYFWTVLWRTVGFCAVNVALTMVLGVLIALLLEALGKRDAAARVGVADRRLVDPAGHGDGRVAVDVRHPVRARQLGARPPGRELARRAAQLLHGRHDHRRVDGHPVRRLHGLRRADPDPGRHPRGGDARRRRRSPTASATSPSRR